MTEFFEERLDGACTLAADDGNNLARSSENIDDDDDDLTYRQGLCITALNNLTQRRGRWDSK